MNKITAADFQKAIGLDPAWASKLTEPVEITTFCDLSKSGITHLSPLLNFTGRNHTGECATFEECQNLKVAEGHFNGRVNFGGSGIEKIGKLHIRKPDKTKIAAGFEYCKNLKVAEGIFPGFVDFSKSGVEKIGDLKIEQNNKNCAASFWSCKNLKVAEGTFPGHVDFEDSGIERIGKLILNRPHGVDDMSNLSGCHNLKTVPEFMLLPTIHMDEDLRARSVLQIQKNEKAKRVLKNQPEIEI